jgi:hypothetical protein
MAKIVKREWTMPVLSRNGFGIRLMSMANGSGFFPRPGQHAMLVAVRLAPSTHPLLLYRPIDSAFL